MAKVYSGWKRGAIYNPATGTVVQLGKLANEGTSYAEETINTDTTQSNVYGGKIVTVQLAFFDSSGYAQLQEWAEADTPVRAVVEGGANLQWYESVPIKALKMLTPDKRTGLNMYQVTLFFASDNPAIYTNQNLLAYLGEVDSGTVVFPVQGANLTLSADATATGGSFDLTLDNFAGTVVSSASQSISATGIASTSDIVDATVYSFDFDISSATAQFPAVTTNGKLANGTSFMDY